MAELKSYETNLEDLRSIYQILHTNFTELSSGKFQSLSKEELLLQIELLKENTLKLESNILSLTSTQLVKEPTNIEGPVAYLYLEGDPGDFINRKIMLLGEVHTDAKKCPPDTNNVSLANFFRFAAAKSPKIIDVFIEEIFGGKQPDITSMSGNPLYLNKLIADFGACLKVDKSECKEPMRIHYADVRYILKYKQSLENIAGFFKTIKFSSDRALLANFLKVQPEWDSPEEIERLNHKIEQIKERRAVTIRLPNNPKQKTQEEIKEEEYEDDPEEENEGKEARLDDANYLFDSYRLDNKRLEAIDPKIRHKVNRYIIQPVFNELYLFLSNRRNRVTYDLIKSSVRKCLEFDLSISENIKHLTRWLSSRLSKVTSAIMEAYFIVRMLKRAGNSIPPRPEVALKRGEPMTHIMAYFGYGHIFNLEKQLTRLGFRVLYGYESQASLARIKSGGISNYVQCIPYSNIREAMERFCK